MLVDACGGVGVLVPMVCSSRNLNLCINVVAALLCVTILNAYLLHTKFQLDMDKDLQEHYAKHIHIDKTPGKGNAPYISSNNPNPNNPNNINKPNSNTNTNTNTNTNSNTGGGIQGNNIVGGKTQEKYPRDTCLPRPTTSTDLLDLPLTVITATSESYVGHVHNLIGSIHTHHPNVEVVVYNLGLGKDTVASLEEYCGVTVKDFDFDAYPAHVQSLKNFAWKALVVKQAAFDYGKVLYLDSGYEVRRPLDFIKGRIEREGYFCTGMGDSLTRGGREGMFNFFHTSTLEYFGLPMSAGGVHGVTYWGGAYQGIILPASECSAVASCITPERNGAEVRSFGKDQPLFSNLVYRGGCTQCAMSNAFTAHNSMAGEAGDPFTAGKQHLFHRRGSGPFNGQGKKRSTCPDWKPSSYDAWQAIRSKYNVTFLGNGCPHTRFSQKADKGLYELGDVPLSVHNVEASVREAELTIVTAAMRDNFPSLEALLDSIDEWEPDKKVVVYDLGLSEEQVKKISGQNVAVEKFSFDTYPHVKELTNGAFRPIVIHLAYARYGSILYLSPTHVLYQRLDTLIFQLQRDGIFTPTIGGNVLDEFSSTTNAISFFTSWPAVPEAKRTGHPLMKEFEFKPLCTTAVLGLWKGSLAASLVLPPLYECSIDSACWGKASAGMSNSKRTDGVLLSLTIYEKICYTCNRDYDFYAYAGKRSEIIHSDKNFELLSKSLIDEVQVIYDSQPQ